MIQKELKNSVAHSSAGVKSTEFSLEASASLYTMLTSNVYTKPILAVIREWSTNACDACIAANLPVKYDVNIPNVEKPEFSVRDYGTGLSPDQVTGLFSSLGASTKRDSNEFNGTLGIGRLAGLAVADAFTVESYYNGTVYSYVISMQQGVPTTMFLGEHPTTELNGLKLTVPVDNPNDFSEYQDAANWLYPFFTHRPNINANITYHEDIIDPSGPDWYFLPSTKKTYSYNTFNYVLMSQVPYVIPQDNNIETYGFTNVVLKAEPGAISFNPGRETLSLDKSTITYINSLFENLKDDFISQATNTFILAENDAEVIKAFMNYSRNVPSRVLESIDPAEFVSDNLKNLIPKPYNRTKISIDRYTQVALTNEFCEQTSHLLQLKEKSGYYKTQRNMDINHTVRLDVFVNSTHIIVDQKTKFKDAINTLFQDKDIIVWQTTANSYIEDAVTAAKAYLDSLGIPYQTVSEILKNTNFYNQTKPDARSGFYSSQITRRGDVRTSQKQTNYKDADETFLLVPLNHTTPVVTSTEYTFDDYILLYNILTKVDSNTPDLRGVPQKYMSFVKDLPNWPHFETYILNEIKKLTLKKDPPLNIPQRVLHDLVQLDLEDGILLQYKKNMQAYRAYLDTDTLVISDNDLIKILDDLGVKWEEFDPPYDVTLNDIKKIYPTTLDLLKFYNCYSRGPTGRFSTISKIAKMEEHYALCPPE